MSVIVDMPIARRALPNGIRVELIVGGDPAAADVAVCSTGSGGAPGPLNELVLGAAGLDVRQLPDRFRPPATLLEDGRMAVLVVETVFFRPVRRRITAAIRANLDVGLAFLERLPEIRTIWFPLIGTGAGNLDCNESAEMILDALADWKPPFPAPLVLLSAPDDHVASLVARAWARPQESEHEANADGDEQALGLMAVAIDNDAPQGAIALRAAMGMANDGALEARHLILGAVAVHRAGYSSPAIEQLAALFPLPATDEIEAARASAGPRHESVVEVAMSRALARHAEPALVSGKLWSNDTSLLTLALLSSDDALQRLAREAGTSLDHVRDRWYLFVISAFRWRPRDFWDDWWRAAGVPLPGERAIHAGYLAESVTGADRLGIDAEAESLARLIVDAGVAPPLSIGLLGDWGSGKSFFLERVQARVDAIAGTAPGLCERVLPIRFNAWHMSDTNLWAGLAGHVFDSVWHAVVPPEAPEHARARLQQELDAANGAVHAIDADIEGARAALTCAERDFAQTRNRLAIGQWAREQTKKALGQAAGQVGWKQPLDDIVQVEETIAEIASARSRLRLLLGTALEGKALRWTLVGIALAVVIGAAILASVPWLGERMPELKQAAETLGRAITFVGPFIGMIAARLLKARAALRDFGKKLEATRDEYDAALRAAESDAGAAAGAVTADGGADTIEGEDRKRVAKAVVQARREYDVTRTRKAAAQQHLASVLEAQAALDPGRRLHAFLEERTGAAGVRGQQSIIALVHRDFAKLAELMKAWRADGAPAGIRPIDRIVLYIDDLDRCSPRHVVQALEAVHLLLALDLFVVVVAVDARWLLRSLEVHYRALLAEEDDGDGFRRTTPQSYLEKIFQITYALAPMTEAGFSTYVDHLMAAPADEQIEPAPAPAGQAGAESGRAAPAPRAAAPEAVEALVIEDSEDDAPAASPDEGAVLPDAQASVAAAPRPLLIMATERAFLKELAPLVPTPRVAKRIVNVFRLVKASVPLEQLAAFEHAGDGRHRPVLLLLAILFGRPGVATALVRGLCEGTMPTPDGADTELLRAAVRALAEERAQADWKTLANDLERMACDVTVAACAAEAPALARYSLITGQEWHTWRPASPPDR